MSENFSSGKKTTNLLCNERGEALRILLLILLLVVAAAGYVFYFTDIIRPQKEAAKPPVSQAGPVKQPIPSRPGQPGEAALAPAAAPASVPAAAPPPAVAPQGEKPVAAPAPPKPEPAKVASTEVPPKPASTPAPAPKPALPAAAPKPVPPAATTAAPVPSPAPATKKEPAPSKQAKKGVKPAAKKKGGPYHLLIGDFGPDKSLGAVLAKLKKSGISPVRKNTVQAPESMNRLYLEEFADQDTAEAELRKVKKLTADAFLVSDNGKYFLYAGSYLSPERAASEMKKLGAKGVKPAIRKARVTVRVTRVTAGSYASAEEAKKDVRRLRKQGVTATVIKAAK